MDSICRGVCDEGKTPAFGGALFVALLNQAAPLTTLRLLTAFGTINQRLVPTSKMIIYSISISSSIHDSIRSEPEIKV
jgi:hypothetical protein